jgi:hypothetical protein
MTRRTTLIASHTSSQRDSWWYLVQEDDGALYVEHHNDDNLEQGTTRKSINEALQTGFAGQELNKLVDRLFDNLDE